MVQGLGVRVQGLGPKGVRVQVQTLNPKPLTSLRVDCFELHLTARFRV